MMKARGLHLATVLLRAFRWLPAKCSRLIIKTRFFVLRGRP
jgi:hypothetical protein